MSGACEIVMHQMDYDTEPSPVASAAAAAASDNRAADASASACSTNELGAAAGHDTTMDVVPTSIDRSLCRHLPTSTDRLRSYFYMNMSQRPELVQHLLAHTKDLAGRRQLEEGFREAPMLWSPYESALRRFNTKIATVAGKKQQQPATADAQQDTSVVRSVVLLPCIIEAVEIIDNVEVRIEAELLYAGLNSMRFTKTNTGGEYEFYETYGKGKSAKYSEYRCPFIFVIRRVSSPISPLQCTVGSFFSSFHAFFRLATTNPGVDGFDAFKLQGTSVSVKDVLGKWSFQNSFPDRTEIQVTVVRDIYKANNVASAAEDLQSYERPRVPNALDSTQPEANSIHHRVCTSITAAAAAAGVPSGIESLFQRAAAAPSTVSATVTIAEHLVAPVENNAQPAAAATEHQPPPLSLSAPMTAATAAVITATTSSSTPSPIQAPLRVAVSAASMSRPNRRDFDAMCRSTTHVESRTVVEKISVVDLLLAQCKFECNSVTCDPANCQPQSDGRWTCPHHFVHLDRTNIDEGNACGRDVVVDNSVLIRMHLDKSNTSFKLKSDSTRLHRRLGHNSVGRSEWDNRILFRGTENLKPITAIRDLYECRVYGFEPLRRYLEQFRIRNYGFYEVELLVRDCVDTPAKLTVLKNAFGGSACLLSPFKCHLKVVQGGVYRPTYQLESGLPSAIILMKIAIPTPPAQLHKLMREGCMIVPVYMKLVDTRMLHEQFDSAICTDMNMILTK